MPEHIEAKCRYCGGCAGACPVNAITVDEEVLGIDGGKCTECNSCVQVCPTGAMVRA